jgi:hypothetical protein
VRTNITLPDALFDPKHWAVEAHGKP